MALFFFIARALAIVVLSGCCVSLPRNQQVENLIPPPSLEASAEMSLETPFFTCAEWPQRNWWEVFESSELNALIGDALANNPTLMEVRSRIAFAQEEAIVARSRLFPWVDLSGIEGWEYLSKNGLYRALNPQIPLSANLIDLKLVLNYTFDFWGKYRNLFIAAIGEEKAREAEAAEAELIISAAVAEAYFALKTDLVRQRLYEKLYSVRKGAFELQTLIQQKALSSKLPTLFSEETVFEAQKLLFSIEDEIAADRHLINLLVGEGPDECLCIDEALPPLPERLALPPYLSIGLLARRPDLMAQLWRAEARAHEVGAAIADFFPEVNLNAFAGLESIAYSFLFQASSMTVGVKPSLSLPLFTAGAIGANVGAKKAEFDEAIFAYNQSVLSSAQEVADLLSHAKAIFSEKLEQERIVKSAKGRYDLTVLRQEKGLDSLFENYAIQVEWIQKELRNVQLLFDQYAATIRLIKALGGGYCAEYLPLHGEGGLKGGKRTY